MIIITGLSGSGKSTALAALEDIGYSCVDNLPVQLLPKILELRSQNSPEVQKLAFGMDLREKAFAEEYNTVFEPLRKKGFRLEILFLEASDEVLIKRYSQTRRQHPFYEKYSLPQSIRVEKELLTGLREDSDKIIDTSDLTVHQLKEMIFQYANRDIKTQKMRIWIISFGFKHGLPLETDLLIDVRFIPNPYFVPELKNLDGKNERVKHFVKKWAETKEFCEKYFSLLEYLIPLYEKEGKSYLTVAVGCTGGRHRSVVIADEIFMRLKGLRTEITLTHRDIELV